MFFKKKPIKIADYIGGFKKMETEVKEYILMVRCNRDRLETLLTEMKEYEPSIKLFEEV